MSYSALRLQMWEKVAAGVACVSLAVDTTPVPMPLAMAISKRVCTGLPLLLVQLLMLFVTPVAASLPGETATVSADMDTTSLFIFTPVM